MDVKEILMKRAMGYDVEEVVEEFSEDENGELKLVKRKVARKFVPPDSIALKFLLASDEESCKGGLVGLNDLTYDELLSVKNDLLSKINDLED